MAVRDVPLLSLSVCLFLGILGPNRFMDEERGRRGWMMFYAAATLFSAEADLGPAFEYWGRKDGERKDRVWVLQPRKM